MKPTWVEHARELWNHQPLPPERRYVLVQVAAGSRPGMPPIVAVGYRKNGAGESDSPYFVVPGVGGPVTHWADCLGDDFHAPLWRGRRPAREEEGDVSGSDEARDGSGPIVPLRHEGARLILAKTGPRLEILMPCGEWVRLCDAPSWFADQAIRDALEVARERRTT